MSKQDFEDMNYQSADSNTMNQKESNNLYYNSKQL